MACPICNITGTILSDQDTERLVIGCVAMDDSAYESASTLTSEDFAFPDLSAIWRIITDRVNSGESVDANSLIFHFRQSNTSSLITELGTCLAGVEPWNIKHYVKILQELSARRQLLSKAERIAAAARNGSLGECDWRETLPGLMSDMEMISATGKPRKLKTIKDVVTEYTDHMMSEAQAEIDKPTLTGINGLDKALDGGIRREYILIGGRSGHGKSLLAMQLAGRLLNDGKRGFVMGYEMSALQTFMRDLARETTIPLNQVMGRVQFENAARIQQITREATRMTDKWDVTFEENPNTTLDQALSTARALHRRKPLDFMVLDYIQYVPRLRSMKLRSDEILVEISKTLGRFQKELGCALICPVQLGDAGEIKEAKGIMEPCQLFIRIEMSEKEDEYGVMADSDDGFLRIIKQRFGEKGRSIPVYRNGKFQRFEDREHVEEKRGGFRGERRKW